MLTVPVACFFVVVCSRRARAADARGLWWQAALRSAQDNHAAYVCVTRLPSIQQARSVLIVIGVLLSRAHLAAGSKEEVPVKLSALFGEIERVRTWWFLSCVRTCADRACLVSFALRRAGARSAGHCRLLRVADHSRTGLLSSCCSWLAPVRLHVRLADCTHLCGLCVGVPQLRQESGRHWGLSLIFTLVSLAVCVFLACVRLSLSSRGVDHSSAAS